ncbi:MAG: hypothetical protein ACRD2F_13435 [Terriglobales bacterium]
MSITGGAAAIGAARRRAARTAASAGGGNMARKRKPRRSRRWIQGSIKHPGALHRQLHIPRREKIPRRILEKFRHARGTLGRRVREALTLESFHRRQKK